MNRLLFIPQQLKAARSRLGLSQQEMAALADMQQKDISLHENKTTKTLIPVRYMLALYEKGIDLNSLFEPGEIRMRDVPTTAERLRRSQATRDRLLEPKQTVEERLKALEQMVREMKKD
ncbi:MAG TPA: hypothetical protein PL070_08725 [Flavobacteriales bacterium]|nr:hypothetical protein [Flavobacteriales bacterium]